MTQGIARSDIHIFVPASQVRLYRNAQLGITIISGRIEVTAQREYAKQWFFKKYGLDHHVLSFDDDVRTKEKRPLALPEDKRKKACGVHESRFGGRHHSS